MDGEQHDSKKWQSRQFAIGAAAAIVGIGISVYMTGVVGAIGIIMLAIGFGGLPDGQPIHQLPARDCLPGLLERSDDRRDRTVRLQRGSHCKVASGEAGAVMAV